MSLKTFHLIFVTVSAILCAGFGAWAVSQFLASRDWTVLVAGVGSFLGVGLLAWYGRWFLHKLKGVGYL